MARIPYTGDLSDGQWELLEPMLPKPAATGRPREVNLREILNGIFYVQRTGCQWRNVPREFGPWGTVYGYFRDYRRAEIWEKIHDKLREKVRRKAGRKPTPSAGSIDSQSVKTAEKGGARGYDAGKRVKGRKRHICVDTMGLILAVVVHSASIQDRDGGELVLRRMGTRFRRLEKIWVDGGYAGRFVLRAKRRFGREVEVVKKKEGPGFQLLPKRWVVERTFGWLNKYRRLSKDYEHLRGSAEATIHLAMIRLMLGRLAR